VQGKPAVTGHATTIEQHIAEVVLAPVVTAPGRQFILRGGAHRIRRRAPAVLEAAAHHVHGLGVTLRRRPLKPAKSGVGVQRYARTRQQHPSHPQLRGSQAAIRCAADPHHRLLRIAAQQFLQLAIAQALQMRQALLALFSGVGLRELRARHRHGRLQVGPAPDQIVIATRQAQ
jgi:hypothetical protein